MGSMTLRTIQTRVGCLPRSGHFRIVVQVESVGHRTTSFDFITSRVRREGTTGRFGMSKTTVPSLLPYQRSLLEAIHDPKNSELVLIARGLGLRKIVCTLLQIYDGPQNLVLLVNAAPEEEMGIGSELGVMGVRNPGLRIVDYEMTNKNRQSMYKKGGLVSVTSRILVVDLLQKNIPVELITGMVILHADKITPTSLESFIVRLYRTVNKDGFIKAFSDQPEQFTQGMFPLKTAMTELYLRKTHIFPRFHEEVQTSLGRRKADVVELYVPMTPRMRDIHQAIVQCMTATLNELKRSNTTLELDDLNVENAYFRSFDSIVRRQLDPVWHKVGFKTKQLANDLGTLRRLLTYLLTLDPITFHSYLETIISSNSSTASNPLARSEKSDWLFTDAAHVIITTAKARCYIMEKKKVNVNAGGGASMSGGANETDRFDDEWDVLDEMTGDNANSTDPIWKRWMPKGMKPVLEEPGKWSVLADVLLEIEREIIAKPLRLMEPGTNVVLIMVGETRTATILQEFLSSMHRNSASPGRTILERRLRSYLFWKGELFKMDKKSSQLPGSKGKEKEQDANPVSEALRMKDQQRAAAKQARRRVRGGGTVNVTMGERDRKKELERTGLMPSEADIEIEAEAIAEFLATQPIHLLDDIPDDDIRVPSNDIRDMTPALNDLPNPWDEPRLPEFNNHYGLLVPEQVVVIRSYGDDGDDQVLSELRPRFIIMFDPNQDFIRRIEVYKSSNPGLAVRVYFMIYHLSTEEHKYLAGQRREKDAFERLIKERGSMLIPIYDDTRSDSTEKLVTVSSRIGGGQNSVLVEPPRVIVDMREFRSSLPNLIDKARMQVIPATLTVGDYILTPDMCVERKSVPDLIQSFISGRLYTQCELMSSHYTYPILLIEFEESKAFSLQTLAEAKTGPKKKINEKSTAVNLSGPPKASNANDSLIQSKLVLLTLAFPRLRVIWSSSPHASAEIFKDLKLTFPEPDVLKAISMGAGEDDNGGGGEGLEDVNTLAEDVVRALPGVGTKNLRYVMGRVRSVSALCEMSLEEVQELLGVEPGKKCYDFIHTGSRPQMLAEQAGDADA
ncbi:hypothetical protein FRB94_004430 [Tulasnella sp. JGI-2019a]|nr:hypothetical protein FRB94_004430 [Tulasnella sp. JGI-2019a]